LKVRFQVLTAVSTKIALMMEAARTSETLVNFYQTTRRYNPEDSHLNLVEVYRPDYTAQQRRRQPSSRLRVVEYKAPRIIF
jgi:hypothetical protein